MKQVKRYMKIILMIFQEKILLWVKLVIFGPENDVSSFTHLKDAEMYVNIIFMIFPAKLYF